MSKYFSISQISRTIGVPIHRILYAIKKGYLKESSNWFLNKRMFSSEEMELIASYFADKKPVKRRYRDEI